MIHILHFCAMLLDSQRLRMHFTFCSKCIKPFSALCHFFKFLTLWLHTFCTGHLKIILKQGLKTNETMHLQGGGRTASQTVMIPFIEVIKEAESSDSGPSIYKTMIAYLATVLNPFLEDQAPGHIQNAEWAISQGKGWAWHWLAGTQNIFPNCLPYLSSTATSTVPEAMIEAMG